MSNKDLIVTINVGGFMCTALKSNYDKSAYIKNLLSNNVAILDEYGYKFIDRDPVLFGYILNYLRTGVPISISADADKSFADCLKAEIKFFKLEDTLQIVGKNSISEISSHLKSINQSLTSIQKNMNNTSTNTHTRRNDWGS